MRQELNQIYSKSNNDRILYSKRPLWVVGAFKPADWSTFTFKSAFPAHAEFQTMVARRRLLLNHRRHPPCQPQRRQRHVTQGDGRGPSPTTMTMRPRPHCVPPAPPSHPVACHRRRPYVSPLPASPPAAALYMPPPLPPFTSGVTPPSQ